jgi:hypothetical protein
LIELSNFEAEVSSCRRGVDRKHAKVRAAAEEKTSVDEAEDDDSVDGKYQFEDKHIQVISIDQALRWIPKDEQYFDTKQKMLDYFLWYSSLNQISILP